MSSRGRSCRSSHCRRASRETARGILTHGVRLAAGRVADYRIWAPTDCLFADAGMLPGLLDAPPLNSVNAARQLLDQAILALDPCVPYVVELKDA